MNTKTVILLFIVGLILQASAFTVSSTLTCNSLTNKANKTPFYDSQIIEFTDDVYEIGATTIWATNNGVKSLFEIILVQNGNMFRAHAIGSDLIVYNQTYEATGSIQVLEVLDHIILVKEFQTGSTSTFKYAAYLFDTNNVASTTLKRIQINALTFPTEDERYGLQFNKILEYDETSNTLYVVMTNKQITQIYTKVLDSEGAFGTPATNVGNSKVSIAAGNHNLMFDDSIKSYYKFKASSEPYDVLPAKTAAGGTQFGPVLLSNFQYYTLMGGAFAITSHSGTENSYKSTFGIFSGTQMIASGEDLTGNGRLAPIVHFNKYNFIFISESIFSFSRYNSKLEFTYQSLNVLSSSDLLLAKTDFQNAYRVSFNVEKQFVLTDKNIIIYELAYNTAGTQVNYMNKLAEISLTSEVTTVLKDDSSQWIKLKIKCSCAKVLVTKLKCFSNRFKCMGINSYIPDDCTIPYADSVPEFA